MLLHRPGPEIDDIADPDAVQMLSAPDPQHARVQHDELAAAYRAAGVEVHLVEPGSTPPPNTMFVADLVFMTSEGAILGRPASTVRAGEEVHVARRLADLRIPVLRTIRSSGTFEGADAAWLDPGTVLVGLGLRTNEQGAEQVAATLSEMGVQTVFTDLPAETMHLMGQLRFADRDLAIAWEQRLSERTVAILREKGLRVLPIPSEEEATRGMALNLVTLGPRRVLMPAGNPRTRAFLEENEIECTRVQIGELAKAAGGIGCMTGVLERGR